MRSLLLSALLALVASAVTAGESGQGAEVIVDARAYDFAKREAELQARTGRVGHLMGIAPGCRFAGVGSSGSINSPRHCTSSKYRLVARAYAIGRNGVVYWSAHYR